MNYIADLHNHTNASDGEYTPTELVQKGKDLGLRAIGVTDHDTLSGLDEALAAGERLGIQVLPGVEVSLRFKRPFFTGTLHYLLYIPRDLLADGEFRAMATAVFQQGRGHGLVQARVDAINSIYGVGTEDMVLKRPLTTDEIESLAPNVTRRHFALALKEGHGLNRKQVSMLIGNDSRAYVPSGIDPSQLTPLLHKYSRLLRIFAHPAAGSFPGESLYNEVLPPIEIVDKLMPEFLDEDLLGLDGLEVHYPGHAPEHRLLMAEWARKYGLLVSGGSDCHDAVERPLGVAGISQEELDAITARL